MQQQQLQARDLMNCRLEHLLLPAGLPEKLGGELPGFAIRFKHPAVCLKLEQFFRWYFNRQPFAEIHLSGAVAPCCQCNALNAAAGITEF